MAGFAPLLCGAPGVPSARDAGCRGPPVGEPPWCRAGARTQRGLLEARTGPPGAVQIPRVTGLVVDALEDARWHAKSPRVATGRVRSVRGPRDKPGTGRSPLPGCPHPGWLSTDCRSPHRRRARVAHRGRHASPAPRPDPAAGPAAGRRRVPSPPHGVRGRPAARGGGAGGPVLVAAGATTPRAAPVRSARRALGSRPPRRRPRRHPRRTRTRRGRRRGRLRRSAGVPRRGLGRPRRRITQHLRTGRTGRDARPTGLPRRRARPPVPGPPRLPGRGMPALGRQTRGRVPGPAGAGVRYRARPPTPVAGHLTRRRAP